MFTILKGSLHALCGVRTHPRDRLSAWFESDPSGARGAERLGLWPVRLLRSVGDERILESRDSCCCRKATRMSAHHDKPSGTRSSGVVQSVLVGGGDGRVFFLAQGK